MRLEEARKQYAGEWIAFQEFEESDNPEGEVKAHHKDRDVVLASIHNLKEDIYITFASIPGREEPVFML